MHPRNLRKPTARRVVHWWDDYVQAWRSLGRAYANERYCERIDLDDVSFARFSQEMRNPSPPNEALIDLFRRS